MDLKFNVFDFHFFASQGYVSKNLKTAECEPWKRDISRRCHCRRDFGEKKSPCYGKLPFPTRAELDHKEDGIARGKAFVKARTVVAKVTLCKFHLVRAASKCLLKKSSSSSSFLCSSVTSVKDRKLEGGLRPKVKQSAPRCAENELAYKITIPVPFDVPLPIYRHLYFPSLYENGFI